MLDNLSFSFPCLLLFLNCVYTLDEIAVSKYVDKRICSGQDLVDKGCFTLEPNAQSRIACFIKCSLNPMCSGVLIYLSHHTCYLGEGSCDLNFLCTPIDLDFKYLERVSLEATTEASASPSTPNLQTSQAPEVATTTQTREEPTTLQTTEAQTTGCQQGGVYDSFVGTCDCRNTGGYVGARCERAATSCTDLYNYNYDPGTHFLNVDLFGDGSVYYRTTCHLKMWFSSQISFDIMRSSGSFFTGLSYTDYVSGFRLGPSDYWIGLENLHKYTADGRDHKVRLTVYFNSSTAQGELAISHYNFVVAPASLGYRYTLDSSLYRGNTLSVQGNSAGFWLDDVLLSQANIPFSTADNDQDESTTRNCAQLAQAGWWFGDCFPFVANPLGWSYWTMPGTTTDQHFHLAGLDMSRSSVNSAVRYVYMALDNP